MNIKFLERELTQDELDKKGLEMKGQYLMAVSMRSPQLWSQFKAMLVLVEEMRKEELARREDAR